ncbi:2145_t:CDS:2, partial [Paraglomus occultum]
SSHNILVQSGTAKIADFGLSSVLKQMSPSHGLGTLAYKDPATFNIEAFELYGRTLSGHLMKNKNKKRGKESDMFGLGVILWEISSGRVPCEGLTDGVAIIMYRREGLRDAPIPGTPNEYINLYSECWDGIPNKRPSCENVYKRLKRLDPPTIFSFKQALQKLQILISPVLWRKYLNLIVMATQHTGIQPLLIIRNVERNPIFSALGLYFGKFHVEKYPVKYTQTL